MKDSKKKDESAGVASALPNAVRTTLEAQGPKLPIGVLQPDKSLIKDFGIRPWRMKEEKELGALRDERRGENVGKYVSAILATMCTRIGPYDFDEIKDFERRLIYISQMLMPDVFYIYFWLRYKSLGPILSMDITCPSCRNKLDFNGNIGTLEVLTAESLEDTRWEYRLRDPFPIRGKDAEGFVLGPAMWNAIETKQGVGQFNVGAAKSSIISGSIQSLIGSDSPIAILEMELDAMSKFDLESITSLLEKRNFGPDLSAEDTCTKCKQSFRMSIDWSYDNFFGISSR